MKLLSLFFFFSLLSVLIVFVGYFFFLIYNLPPVDQLKAYQPPLISFVFDREGEKIGEFFRERRILVSYEEFPEVLVQAFVAAEDGTFFKHKGLNVRAIFRAFLANIRAGRKVQGGSTITQQVARALLLSSEKTYARKLKEAVLALRMERHLSKEHILYLYLNQIYLGHGAYGVGMASEIYFRKKVEDLNLAEASLLAGLPQAPSRFSPIYSPQKAKERQLYALQRMVEEKYIQKEEAKEVGNSSLKVYLREEFQKKAPYYQETLRQILSQELGEDNLLSKGFRIETSMDIRLQQLARQHLQTGLKEIDKRQGFRGASQHLEDEEQINTFFANQEKKILNRRQPFQIIESLKEVEDQKQIINDEILEESKPVLTDLEKKELFEGLVREVDDQEGQVLVQLPFNNFGILPLEYMKWARKPDPKVYYAYSTITQPSMALKKGDVILVQIVDQPETDKSNESDELNMELKGKNISFFVDKEQDLPENILLLSLEQEPAVEGAVIVFHRKTGDILAMVGGYDFNKSQFNRAYQASRQTGSVFKPIVYLAALDKGFSPSTVISDAPVVFEKEEAELSDEDVVDENETKENKESEENPEQESEEYSQIWKPNNYGQYFSGDILFRNALIRSMNVPTVKVIERVGIKWVQNYARRLGIFSSLNPDYTLALGSSSVTLYEMTKVFAVISRLGKKITPWLVQKVIDSQQHQEITGPLSLDRRFLTQMESWETLMEQKREKFLIEQEKNDKKLATEDISLEKEGEIKDGNNVKNVSPFFFSDPEQLISEETAFIMNSLLSAVINEPQGTGYAAHDMKNPIAGKTGTTNGYYDAWFIGYNSQLVTGVWVGFDNEQSLGIGETGGKTALPIWKNFMQAAEEIFENNEEFKIPIGIVFTNIDNETGGVVGINSKRIVKQAFIDGTQPVPASEKDVRETEDQDFLRKDLIQ